MFIFRQMQRNIPCKDISKTTPNLRFSWVQTDNWEAYKYITDVSVNTIIVISFPDMSIVLSFNTFILYDCQDTFWQYLFRVKYHKNEALTSIKSSFRIQKWKTKYVLMSFILLYFDTQYYGCYIFRRY